LFSLELFYSERQKMEVIMKSFLNIKNSKAATILLLFGGLTWPIFGQTDLSYSGVISLIGTFESQWKNNAPQTDNVMLGNIFQGMIANNSAEDSEGLKKRLVGSLSTAKMKAQGTAVGDTNEAQLLALMYYTEQSVVPAFIEDTTLRGRVGKNGAAILKAQDGFWKTATITNCIDALEAYPPETAAGLVKVIATTWYQGAAKIYEDTDTSWASESLWQIYDDIRTVELARHSLAVKLLANEGLVTLPTVTYADFAYSGWPSIPITIPPAVWTGADLADLVRLLGNPYYKLAAQKQLVNMIPGIVFIQ
jgi:hypothetical protein